MLHRLRRVRVPSSLEGYGPGRPSSSAALAAPSPPLASTSTSASFSQPLSQSPAPSPSPSSSSPQPPPPPSASSTCPPHDGADAGRPLRQKMPLGSDRREGEPEPDPVPVAGPSTTEARKPHALGRIRDGAVDEPKRARGEEADTLSSVLRSEVGASRPTTVDGRADAGEGGGSLGGAGGAGGGDDTTTKPKPMASTTDIPLPMVGARDRTARPRTVIDAALARPNPPSPRALLSFVKSRPQLYSPPAAIALAAYAKRTNDSRVQKGASDLLSKLRLSPLRLDAAPQPEPMLADLVAKWRIADVEPNTMLLKRYPPLPPNESEGVDITSSPTLLLRRFHYLYLAAEAVSLPGAIQMLHDAHGSKQHRQALLHLLLAYTPELPFDLLVSFAALAKPTPWTRQTVHLAVGALLRFYRTHKPSTRAIMDDIRTLLSTFESPDPVVHRTPGPETWRHIGEYALETDDETLAHLAFLGARNELAAERQRSWAARAKATVARAAHSAASADETAHEPPQPRFLNLGRHLSRFERLMHRFETRGWATRRSAADGEQAPDLGIDPESPVPRLMQKWDWCGRAGEAAALERAQQKAREQEEQQEQQVQQRRRSTSPRNKRHVDEEPAQFRFAPDVSLLTQHARAGNDLNSGPDGHAGRGAGKKGRKGKRRTAEEATVEGRE